MNKKHFQIYLLTVILYCFGCVKSKCTTFEFVCHDGASVKVTYFENGEKASLVYDGKVFKLKRTISGSGARYSDGEIVFWNKGDKALIEIDGKIIHQDCELLENVLGK